jgi:hypothetical protein
MLLFHVSVQSWVGKIGLVAVLALEISSSIVVLGSSLSTLVGAVSIFALTI